jgi:MYXO-CTERM domain-containing protein
MIWALLAVALAPDTFTYRPSGELVPGSGQGRVDDTVYAPDMLFPIEDGPDFANSQVWGHGGASGPGGSQCDAANFAYPWHDNFCETRSWDMPLCPAGIGHQGQDIRGPDCMDNVHWVDAVDDGTITSIGSYTVYLTVADGTRFDYLHMRSVQVAVGQHVTRGQRLGKISNNFGDSATTVHLHFNIRQNVADVGMVFVPPYDSLIAAYQRKLGAVAADAGVAAADAAVSRPDAAVFPRADGSVTAAEAGDFSGAACQVGRRGAPPGAALALLMLLLASARRRRARAPAGPAPGSRA